MTCYELRPDYMLYAMGVLEEPERAELRAHLDRGCESCTAGMREARQWVSAGRLGGRPGAAAQSPEPHSGGRRRGSRDEMALEDRLAGRRRDGGNCRRRDSLSGHAKGPGDGCTARASDPEYGRNGQSARSPRFAAGARNARSDIRPGSAGSTSRTRVF